MRRQIAQIREEAEVAPVPGRRTQVGGQGAALDADLAGPMVARCLEAARNASGSLAHALGAVDAPAALQAVAVVARELASAREAARALSDGERAGAERRIAELRAAVDPLVAKAPAFARIDVDAALAGSWIQWDHDIAQWTAARAADTAASALPFRDEIQARFGRHDVSGVRAHVSAAAAKALGARAFAHGERVVFAGAPDLHTAAHEAAHVVGVADEHHADLVADAVVRGESAQRLLDTFAERGRGAAVVQRKDASEPAKTAPGDPTLLPGQAFDVDPRSLTMTARRSWLAEDPQFEATGRAPEKFYEMLRELQRRGGITWAKEDGLRRIAQTQITQVVRDVVRVYISTKSLLDIGLPPASAAWVSRVGNGLDVVVRVDFPDESLVPLGREDIERFLTAIERFTGLAVIPAVREETLGRSASAEIRGGLAYVAWSEAAMRYLVGDDVWAQWLASRVRGDGTEHGISTGAELTSGERARLNAWFAANAPIAMGHLPKEAHATRELLGLVDEIDASQDRAAILAFIAAHQDSDEALDPRSVRRAIDAVRFARERLELGLVMPLVTKGDADGDEPERRDQYLPAKLTQHAGLVLDGDSVPFEVVVDLAPLHLTERNAREFRAAAWRAEIDWVVERADGRGDRIVEHGIYRSTEKLGTSAKLSLQPGEESAVFIAHAFVASTRFLPTHLTTKVEVKTEKARMADLRGAMLGPVAETLEQDGHGRFLSLSAFTPRTGEELAASRLKEVELYQRAATYLEGLHDEANAEAIAQLHHAIEKRQKAVDAVAADGQSFDLRATYLSKTDGFASGPLEIYGTRKSGPMGSVVVTLHDFSRRYDNEDRTYTGSAAGFEGALRKAFNLLSDEYPKGHIALYVASTATIAGIAIGGTLGFERETSSTRKWVRDNLFSSNAQLAVNLAGLTVMCLAPEAAPVITVALVVYNAAYVIDDLDTKMNDGTLTTTRAVLDVGQLVLSMVPLASSAKAITVGSRAMFMLELASHAGDVMLMGLQVKETLEQIEAQDVAVIAHMYRELVDLEKTTHPSDPALAKLRAEIQDRAMAMRNRLQDAVIETVGPQAVLMVSNKMMRGLAHGPAVPHEPGVEELPPLHEEMPEYFPEDKVPVEERRPHLPTEEKTTPKAPSGPLTAEEHERVAELRVLREQGNTEEVKAAEKKLGLDEQGPAAEQRRRMVETQIEVQKGAAAREEEAKRLGGDRGHPGIEVHSHFMGIVAPEMFRERAATAGGAKDTGSWLPLFERLYEMSEGELKSKLTHQRGTDGQIEKRSNTGDAMDIVREARRQIKTLQEWLKDTTLSRDDQAAYRRAIEHVAEEASISALSSTPETPFDGAYVLRGKLVETTFGGGERKSGESAKAAEQRQYDDYIREALLRLAAEGVHYSEQSTGSGKLDGSLHPDRIEHVLAQLIAEGKLQPGQVEVKMLTMLKTDHFGDGSSRGLHDKDTNKVLKQVEGGGVIGVDIGAPERLAFTPEGMRRWTAQLVELSNLGKKTGEPQLARPHVGEGVVDTLEGQSFHTDKNRQIIGGEPSHYSRARHNLDMMLDALDALPPGVLDPKYLTVRFGHAAHATPEQAARMKRLGVIAEVNLGSNVATGSVSQTDRVDGPRATKDRFDDHAFPSLVYYDAQILLSTDGAGVMTTTLAQEYARARTILDAVLSGDLPVRISISDATGPNGVRGAEVAGRPNERKLRIWEMTPDERGRFERGYRKLYDDAERYYRARPQGNGAPAVDLSPYTRIATNHNLALRFGNTAFQGDRASIEATLREYRDSGYRLSPDTPEAAAMTVVTSHDNQVTLTFTIEEQQR